MSVESFRGPGGATLFYRYDDFTDPWKDAPTVVMSHGHPRNSNLWYAWVPPLARLFRIARVDLRGLGLSKVPIETYQNSPEALMLDAITLLDHLKLDKAIWIGEATGGLLGLLLAARVPDRLHALVIMNAPLKVAEARIYEQTKDLRPGESIVGQGSIDFMLSKGMRAWSRISIRTRPWLKEAPQGYVEWYAGQIAQNDPRLAAEFYRPMPNVDLLPLLKDISVPTMYLEGTHDSMNKPEYMKMLEQAANVRVVTVEGPGMDIGYARPDACVGHVKAFLKELGLLDVIQ